MRLAIPSIRIYDIPMINRTAQFWHKNIHADKRKIIPQEKSLLYIKVNI